MRFIDRLRQPSKGTLALVGFLVALSGCSRMKIELPEPVGPVPSPAQLKWQEMETNAFIHFTINTFTDKEWGFGDEKPSLFNPSEPDVDQWISTLKEAGFKGVILTTKHHDGFCLWPSQYTQHTIQQSPYKNGEGDLVKEVSEACRKHEMQFGIYLSPWDRNRSDYGNSAYIEYYRNQLRELFTNYGPVFEMWFDGANGGDGHYGGARETRRIAGATYYEWPVTLDAVKKMQPDVLFFSDAGPHIRWVGNEKGIAGTTNWNTITPDTLYAGKPGIEELLQTGSEDGTHWIPAEVDVSIRPGWFYHQKEDSLVKSGERLFDIYLSSVGRGSTLLLNVPPDRRGKIHENDLAALKEYRRLIDESFKNNLAKNATVISSTIRGDDKRYSPMKTIDGEKNTYWATDDAVNSGWVELSLAEESNISFVMMQEYISLGQRVKEFSIEVFVNGSWQEVSRGTTIGYKRIVKIDPVRTAKVRINLKDAKACPVISSISLY